MNLRWANNRGAGPGLTRSGRMILLALVCAVALPAAAQRKRKKKDPPKDDKKPPAMKVIDKSTIDRPKTEQRKGPGYVQDTRRSERKALADDKREEAIQTLLDILEIEDPNGPGYPEALVRLADQYWQKSEDFGDKAQSEQVLKCIYDAEENKDAAGLAKCRAQQQGFLSEQQKWRRQTIITYQQIEKDHPSYKDLDQVLYSLGYHLTLMGEHDEGYAYYAKLVLQRPTSPLIPDTYLNIGDYFFGYKNDFQQALAFYDKVKQFGETRVRGYAIYKSGWCWFNLGDKAKAMNFFYETIKWTIAAEKRGSKVALDLRSEAQFDMVRAYSFIGAPNKALKFFKKVAPEMAIKLCEKLAIIYTNDSNYGASNQVYRGLMDEVGDDYRRLPYQREIVYNTFKSGDKKRTRDEVAGMTKALESYLTKLPEKIKSSELQELDNLLQVIGTEFHREAEKTLEKETQLQALFVYEQYLRWFPKAKGYYTMAFNVAILAYQMEEYGRAAPLFEKVVALKPEKGEFLMPAAQTAMMCYYKTVNLEEITKSTADAADAEDLKELPIEGNLAKMLNAAERYIKLISADDPDAADEVGEAIYAAGRIYFAKNRFDTAAPYFEQLYKDYRDHDATPEACRLLLTVHNLGRNIDKLFEWAAVFEKDVDMLRRSKPLQEDVERVIKKKDFLLCAKLEGEDKPRDAGDCYLAYFRKFRDAEDRVTALKNSAIMYLEAKQIERALVASEELYNCCSDTQEGPQALYNIGQIYRAIAVYGESAHYYELYAKQHPKHNEKLIRRALARAAIFRKALGEYDKAADNYVSYYKRFKKDPKAGDVFFEIGLIYESQQNWKGVIKHFKKYLKTYGKETTKSNVLIAHSKMGMAYWKQKRAKKKQALKEFATALQLFDEMDQAAKAASKELELTAKAVDAVAAAKFFEGEVVLAKMKAIKLKLPQKVFTKRLGEKVQLIDEATERMKEVANYGRPHWEIAAYNRIGQAYQNLAEAIENAPIPRNVPEDVRYMIQEEFLKKSTEIRAKAVEAYRICVKRAKEKQWFNEYSENAEKNLARLDLEFKFTRELRPQPKFFEPLASVPPFDDSEAFSKALEESKKVRDWVAESSQVQKIVGLFETAGEGQLKARALYNVGLVEMRKRNTKAALSKFEAAAAADPQFANAQAMIGMARERLGMGGAETNYQAALQIEKFNAIANTVDATKNMMAQNWTNSIAKSRTALIGYAESPNAYLTLARVYYEQKQYDLARLVCEQALELDPLNAPIQNLLGLTFLRLEDVRAALVWFERATKSNPNLPEAHLNLASTVLNYGDFERADKHFGIVLKLQPNNNRALVGRAVARRGLKRFDDSLTDYDEVLKREPNNVDVRYNKCLLLAVYAEKYEDGLKVCEEFVSMAPPNHAKRKEIEKRLPGIRDTIKFMKEDAEMQKQEGGTPPADGEAPPAEGDAPADGEPSSDS